MKKFLSILLTITLSLTLTGCKKKDPNGGRLIAEGQTATLQIWTAKEPEVIEALAREFVSATRTPGLNISVLHFATEDELHDFLIEKMAENAGPDVIFTDGEWIHQNTKKLSPILNDESFTPSNYTSTFLHAGSEAMIKDKKIYGVPIAVDTMAIFYNKEHLIDRLTDDNKPAKSWTDFRKDVEKLSIPDNSFERFAVSGAAIGRSDNLNYGFEILENIMYQSGVTFFDPSSSAAKFASSKGVNAEGKKINFGEDAIEFFTSFNNKKYKNFSWSQFLANPKDTDKEYTTFAEGKTSMVFGYAKDLDKIEKILKKSRNAISIENIGVVPLPKNFARKNSQSDDIIARVYGFAVPQTTKFHEIAWKFLKFAAKKENIESFAKGTGYPVSRLDLITSQADDPVLGVFIRQAKVAKNNFLAFDRAKIREDFNEIITKINTENTNILTELENLEENYNDYLAAHIRREKKIEQANKQ